MRLAASLLSCLLLLPAGSRAADQPQILTPNASSFESLSRFIEVLEALQKNYAQPSRIDISQHTLVALRAFVRSVDPEADLLAPNELASTDISSDASGNIGLSFAIREDYPIVIAPRDDSPAQDAGLLAGERLIAVNGTPTLHARRVEVERLLRGPANSPVTLRVLDPTTSTVRDVQLLRAVPNASPGVALKFLDKGVAYCRVPEFSVAAVEQLHAAMVRAKSERASSVILDLRNNAGGAFEAAQVAASIFLPKDANIVALEYANPNQRTTFVSDQNKKFTAPVVVLVNGGTAGEAEVFAAALQDNKRAQLVGSKTFGRGFLVAPVALGDGFVLSVPTAYYLRPSKQSLQGVGLKPDLVVDLPRDTERLLDRLGFSTFDWAHHKTQVLRTDLPLAKALSLLGK